MGIKLKQRGWLEISSTRTSLCCDLMSFSSILFYRKDEEFQTKITKFPNLVIVNGTLAKNWIFDLLFFSLAGSPRPWFLKKSKSWSNQSLYSQEIFAITIHQLLTLPFCRVKYTCRQTNHLLVMWANIWANHLVMWAKPLYSFLHPPPPAKNIDSVRINSISCCACRPIFLQKIVSFQNVDPCCSDATDADESGDFAQGT